MDENAHLGKVISMARALRGWSLSELHERSGVSVSIISQTESGKRMPMKRTLKRLFDALEIETGE